MASRYSKQQLKRMAMQVLAAQSAGDMRAEMLVNILAAMIGANQAEVLRRIQGLANA